MLPFLPFAAAAMPFILGMGLLFAEETDGVRYRFEEGSGQIEAQAAGPFRLRLTVTPSSGAARTLRVELPESGPKAWPVADVRVVDAEGGAVAVRRSGIEWAKLLIPLAPELSGIVIEAVEPAGGLPARTTDRDRRIEDGPDGAGVRIATWPGGKEAALSFRFDDSDPSHLDKVDPILREFGFRGTFMVNPGPDEPGSRRRSAFQARLEDWKALAERRDHELANHTARHRGAENDEEMEAEIRLAADIIREVAPHQGRLMALNLGGGTMWTTTRTLRHYLQANDHFEISGSLGMDDVYGARVEAFRKHLESHLGRGLWARVHYHAIGEGKGASEANFRAVLGIAAAHRDRIWNAGMAEIHRYQTARDGARLVPITSGPGELAFRLETTTDPALYDRPLELEALLPAAWGTVRIENGGGEEIPHTLVPVDGRQLVRFELPSVGDACRILAHP